jgi:tRNA(Ile)-lysidine synthase
MIFDFLNKNINFKQPVLLALSGGADSKALLHCLLDFKKFRSFDLHIAHVDHGWRKESEDEASQLKQLAINLNIPFHIKKIQIIDGFNKEDFCRNERMSFFSLLQEKYNYQALLMAHHRDDLCETILKRIFEGASFNSLLAMDFITSFNNLTIWRPFLDIPKSDLIAYLNKLSSSYFNDYTNFDNQFLRARFRNSIIPQLAQTFGKALQKPLIRHAKESKEFYNYLQNRIEDLSRDFLYGPFGVAYDFNKIPHLLEQKYLLKKMAQSQDRKISFAQIDAIIKALNEKAANFKIINSSAYWVVDRGFVFLVTKLPYLDNWVIQTSEEQSSDLDELKGWKSVWKGKIRIPKTNLQLAQAKANEKFKYKSTLDKWWNQHKVPAFLRRFVPVLKNHEMVLMEFLSGHYFELQTGVELEWVNLIYIS